ncbi:hypothetical protein [Streptococcus hillyeri]|uniref:Lipoprotein n=1 Tax=Streptococcus hillyeri TaxID=2282420 RepID=A0A3L9DTW7_9STRE|nr:hypothetical protein [Streptococcus hillyeri]RLY02190.1 hypothetical protein EAF07_08025 [Streptococcus hillyeri]
MKKSLLTTITLLSVITLAACSSSKNETNKSSGTQSAQTETTTTAKPQVDNSKYDAIVNKLNTELNPDGSSDFEAKIVNNVVDSDFPEGHNVIQILLKGEAKKSMEEVVNAIDSNTANAEQKNTIAMLQMVVSQMAKELPDDTTTIDLGYEISADQNRIIAKSSKIKDIISVTDIVME